MKFDHVQAYGSTGGVVDMLDVTAHIIGSGSNRIEDVRRVVLHAPDTLAALVETQEAYRRLLIKFQKELAPNHYVAQLAINQRAVDAIHAARGEA
jgi:hypothetical protein